MTTKKLNDKFMIRMKLNNKFMVKMVDNDSYLMDSCNDHMGMGPKKSKFMDEHPPDEFGEL